MLAPHKDITTASQIEILHQVGLGAFLDQSEAGLETLLGSKRAKYNLGFRKRLALARAALTDGAFVIMDEPTEGLDRRGAEIFYAYLNQAVDAGKTVIVLSHDPAIIKGADTIFDLNQFQAGMNASKEGIQNRWLLIRHFYFRLLPYF